MSHKSMVNVPRSSMETQEGMRLKPAPSNPGPLLPDSDDAQERFFPQLGGKRARARILETLRLLWVRRKFVRRCVLAGFIASALIAFLIPKEFISTAQLMPPDSQSGSGLAMMASLAGQNGAGLGSIAGDLLGMKTTGALFIAVMRSRTVADRLIQRFDLAKVYRTRLEESARLQLERNTEISDDRKSGVITLSVTDHDPRRAASIAAAYIEELDTLMAQLNTSSAHRERVFLEERLSAVKSELESSERDFSQFASKNDAVDISAQGKAMLEGEAKLQGELIAAESELEGLRQIYSDNNVRIRSTQARINELRSQQTKLTGNYDAGFPSADESTSPNGYPTLRQLPILGVPYADKFRKLKVDEAVFETLTKQYELARVQEAKEIPSVKVLDLPEIPERKSYPPRLLIILGGTLCGLILATIWLFGARRWKAIDPQEPALIFAREALGAVRVAFPRAFTRHPVSSERPSNCTDASSGPSEASRIEP
jgi:uncharacterized protein involved in exopolysaccharide biosynthesis